MSGLSKNELTEKIFNTIKDYIVENVTKTTLDDVQKLNHNNPLKEYLDSLDKVLLINHLEDTFNIIFTITLSDLKTFEDLINETYKLII